MNWVANSCPSNKMAISYRPGPGKRMQSIGTANSILTSRWGKLQMAERTGRHTVAVGEAAQFNAQFVSSDTVIKLQKQR